MAGVATATQQSSRVGYQINNIEHNVEGLDEKVLDSTIKIPPTATCCLASP